MDDKTRLLLFGVRFEGLHATYATCTLSDSLGRRLRIMHGRRLHGESSKRARRTRHPLVTAADCSGITLAIIARPCQACPRLCVGTGLRAGSPAMGEGGRPRENPIRLPDARSLRKPEQEPRCTVCVGASLGMSCLERRDSPHPFLFLPLMQTTAGGAHLHAPPYAGAHRSSRTTASKRAHIRHYVDPSTALARRITKFPSFCCSAVVAGRASEPLTVPASQPVRSGQRTAFPPSVRYPAQHNLSSQWHPRCA